MAFTIRNQKDMENELHEQLYNNILVLSLEFPTSKDFNTHFKKDMFVKNNKTAFQHTIHFLLNVFDPVSFKQKVCWPIMDNKMETQFRNEVMKYINEITSSHEGTGIPLLMTSHVISPGGFRFVEFMHKLSQFILLEHLNRDEINSESVLLPMKADSDLTIATQQLKYLNKIADDHCTLVASEQVEFHTKYNTIKQDATNTTDQMPKIDKTHIDVKYEFRECQEKMKAELANIVSCEEIIAEIDDQLQGLRLKETDFKYCTELVDVLNLNRNILTYEKQSSKTDDSVDLVECLESFYDSVKKKKHVAQYGKNFNFTEQFVMVNQAVQELSECYDKYEKLNSELLHFLSLMEEFIANFSYGEYFGDSMLLQRVRKVYETVPFVNIRTTNLV